jgi:hypothetical protein
MFSMPGEVADAGQPVAGGAPAEPGGAELPARMFSTMGGAAVPTEAPAPERMFSTMGGAVAPAEDSGQTRMFSMPELVGLFADEPTPLPDPLVGAGEEPAADEPDAGPGNDSCPDEPHWVPDDCGESRAARGCEGEEF